MSPTCWPHHRARSRFADGSPCVRLSEPVDIILLAYNRLDYLSEMVDALERETQWPYRLTVVDNVSGPETRNWLRAHRSRFHQIVWNRRNEHLAGYQRGIERTSSSLFVVSDADVLPHPPTDDGCWLTRLLALADRHPDFGLISARLDSVAGVRDIRADKKRLIDDELLETSTGVWLNLIRRRALRVPYMSDGITSYSIRRTGYRVGVAAHVLVTHLGDQDSVRHPDYLARKQASSGIGTVYPVYPELAEARRPPLLRELAVAAPVLAAFERQGVDPGDAVELSREAWPPLSVVEPRVECCVRGRGRAAARWTYRKLPPIAPGGAAAVALICPGERDDELLRDALATAGEWVFLLSPSPPAEDLSEWSLLEEQPGPATMIERLALIGSSRRFRRLLFYSTVEHRQQWLKTMRAGCFDGPARLRMFVFRRNSPLPPTATRWRVAASPGAVPEPGLGVPSAPRWRPPLRPARIGPLLTKAWRLVRAEWYLRRAPR
jgi:Glycosyl transferase family 2